ncbi:MAG TPA: VOC family protein, partial [Myxococcales bacterium]
GHAEMRIGNSIFMLADESPEHGARAPQGPSPVHLVIYCEDVDKVWKRSLAAGGKELRPLQNQFYGDRSGTLADPFGHQWTVGTHVEDVSPEEMQRRMPQPK